MNLPEGQKFKTLDQLEKEHIYKALVTADWNVILAAKLLGIGRATVYRKIQQHEFKQPTRIIQL